VDSAYAEFVKSQAKEQKTDIKRLDAAYATWDKNHT
jgi:hypothetical protein